MDKGDVYRSRWVAKQFKDSDMEEWFAATPPVEAFRMIISEAVTLENADKMGDKCLMVNDVSRALFYEVLRYNVYGVVQ